MQPANTLFPIRRWRGVSLAMWALLMLFFGLPGMVYLTVQAHAKHETEQQAQNIHDILDTVRTYYARNVAGSVLRGPRPETVSENYHDTPGSIPIPATFSIELGEALDRQLGVTGTGFRFVSDVPFMNRQRPPLDSFMTDALKHFRSLDVPPVASGSAKATRHEGHNNFRQLNPNQFYWRVEDNNSGQTYLRVASPVRMEPTCIACHNSHPLSPVRDWKVGDIRGLQEVQVKFNTISHAEHSVPLGLYLLIFGTVAFASVGEHRRAGKQLVAANAELESSRKALLAQQSDLECSVRDLRTKTQVIDRAPFGVLVFKHAARNPIIASANEAFDDLFGYTPGEVVGQHPRILFGPETETSTAQNLLTALANATAEQAELNCTRRDGQVRRVHWHVFPCRDPEGELINMVAVLNDVTVVYEAAQERQRLAAELQESSKLEFLGLTIAGMAHDLNTPIGIAVTSASHTQQSAQKLQQELHAALTRQDLLHSLGERIARSSDLTVKNLAKASQLIQGFKRTSAEVTRTEWRLVNLHDLIESLLITLSPLLKRAHCTAELQCPAKLSLSTEPGSLTQALSNLLVNATIHAFEGRDQRTVRIDVTESDAVIHIDVSDNGNGMDKAALAHAFTPFFTTRRQSGGSGLGLFSSRRVVEQTLGGKITVESQVGVGTRFRIELPLPPTNRRQHEQ